MYKTLWVTVVWILWKTAEFSLSMQIQRRPTDHSILSESIIKVRTSGRYCLRESSSPWSDWARYLKLRCAEAVWESRLSPPAGPSGNHTWSSAASGPVLSSLCHSRRHNHTCLIPENRKRMSVMEKWEKNSGLIFSRCISERHITKINTMHLSEIQGIFQMDWQWNLTILKTIWFWKASLDSLSKVSVLV